MTSIQPTLAPQFDRILSRIEAGEVEQGITHLTGMLDAVMIECSDPAAVRTTLLAHPLGAALQRPWLATEAHRQGIAQALQARAALISATLDHAERRGQRRCVMEAGEVHSWALPPGNGCFDLIFAAELPDALDTAALDAMIAAAAMRLCPGGRLVLSAFVPGHLGCGWQSIWLGQSVIRHEPAAIERAARAAGLEPRQFHDASDCLVWAELRRSPASIAVATVQGDQP